MNSRVCFAAAGATVALVTAALAGAAPAGARAGAPARWQAISQSSSAQPRGWLSARHTGPGPSDAAGDGAFRNPIAPTVAVGGNPVAVAVDAANGTVYVGNGNDSTMSVVNGATCNATVNSGCGQRPPTVPVGPGPADAVVDQATHTVYVVNAGTDTVSVLDANACNATHTAGCATTPPTITVGNSPDGLAIDQATHTLYVTNAGSGTVSVINAATCNASDHSGCTQVPPTVTVGPGPAVPAVNTATDTVYVPNSGTNTVSVINGATCNAANQSGCGQVPPTITAGPTPFAAAVDQPTDTVYVTSAGLASTTSLGSVFVINGATCNGTSHSGCGQSPPAVTVGSVPIGVIVDPASGDVIVLNEEDSSVSLFSAAACNATRTAGCRTPVLTLSVGHNPGYLDVDPATHTLYVSNQNDNTVSVLDTLACTPDRRAGCRIAAPVTTVGLAPQGIAADTATGTVYVANRTDGNLSVISSAACNAGDRSGCGRHWPTVAAGPFPQAVAVDQATGTVYTANCDPDTGCTGDTVSVIDAATCNAQVISGCGKAPATVPVGSGANALAVNPATDTVYVASINAGTVSVINGATCNGTNHTGCAATPPAVNVGGNPGPVAIDQATDTIYVVNFAGSGSISVINGATCNGTNHTGCAATPPSFTTNSPAYVAVAQATNTIYVANSNTTTISVINGATCNAANQSGCGHATAMTANSPTGDLAVDQCTGTVFADLQFYGSEVLVLDGARCNAHVTTGCGQAPAVVPVGGWPGDLAAIPATRTLYVTDNVDGEASLFGYVDGNTYP